MSPRTPSRAQIDLFPEHPVIERLDPRAVVGPRTAAQAVIRVRMRTIESPHLVFHDRHGWYCETHGAGCEAVAVARETPEITAAPPGAPSAPAVASPRATSTVSPSAT